MSQSPEDALSSVNAIAEYRHAWATLSQLIGKGRSFSGRERNCVFLNTRNGEFADVSAVTTADFAEDSRAVATVDWDFDGRMDLWLTNRTAPRVRFLRNATTPGQNYLAVRLRGVDCNLDAIGARVEVDVVDSPPQVRTLRAGDGFLSQSSKWLHFGLGDTAKVRGVVVHWPGGNKEIFRVPNVNAHYELVQHSGEARRWKPPTPIAPLVSRPVKLPTAPAGSRTWLIGRVPMPECSYDQLDGTQAPLDDRLGKPLLVNLWSNTCAPCIAELNEWSNHEPDLADVGLRVLALNVDRLSGGDESAAVEQRQSTSRIEYGWARADLVNAAEIVQRSFLELQQPLPLPASLLLDRHGRVVAIYKGRIELARLLEDVALLDATLTQQRDSAVPYPGRWASNPFSPQPLRVAGMFLASEQSDQAIAYLRRFISGSDSYLDDASDVSQTERIDILAGVYTRLGELLLEENETEEAVDTFAQLISIYASNAQLHRRLGEQLLTHQQPRAALQHFALAANAGTKDAALLYNTGLAELACGNPSVATEHFEASVALRPEDFVAHFQLANAQYALGNHSAAIDSYRRALEQNPNWPFAANNLAWILATTQQSVLRNPVEALRLALTVTEQDEQGNPDTLATLAVAYAANGNFEEAAEVNRRAIDLARKLDKRQLVEDLQRRQQHFEQGEFIH